MATVLTKILNSESILISENLGLNAISIVLQSGSGKINGNLNIGTLSSEEIPLTIGQPINIDTNSSGNAIDDLRIDARPDGVILIVARQ